MPDPNLSGQWGILGGTFDPVHLGHLTLAAQICKRKKLDGVMLIPSYAHPFKSPETTASYDDRMAMLKLAIEGYDDLSVSSIERDLGLSGLTVDTIKAVKKEFPMVKFYFLIGADNFSQIHSWHKAEELMAEVKVLVGYRPGFDFEEELKDTQVIITDFEIVKTDELPISSTEIRTKIKEKVKSDNLAKMIPLQVIQYIKANGLYL